MRKGDDGEKKNGKKTGGKKEKKIKTFLVATNVVASRPPERRPTGTPTDRANKVKIGLKGGGQPSCIILYL